MPTTETACRLGLSLLEYTHNCKRLNFDRNRVTAMDSLLRVLGGSIMVRVLLAVLTVLVVYALGKVVAHFWKIHRAFRGLPRHPKMHWLWGHSKVVCYNFHSITTRMLLQSAPHIHHRYLTHTRTHDTCTRTHTHTYTHQTTRYCIVLYYCIWG